MCARWDSHGDELSLEVETALEICSLSCGIFLEFIIGPEANAMEQTALERENGESLHWRLVYLHKKVQSAERVRVLSEVATQKCCFVFGEYTFVLFDPCFKCGTDVPRIKGGIDR
jgi:hypothetical protein